MKAPTLLEATRAAVDALKQMELAAETLRQAGYLFDTAMRAETETGDFEFDARIGRDQAFRVAHQAAEFVADIHRRLKRDLGVEALPERPTLTLVDGEGGR